MWSPSLHIYGWPQLPQFPRLLSTISFQQPAITAGWGHGSSSPPALLPRQETLCFLWSQYQVGYLFGRRLPKDVLYPDPDAPVICTAWAAEKPNLRRQEGRGWHTRCLGGHLPACPGTSTKGTLDGPSATAGVRPLSALTDHPGDGILLKNSWQGLQCPPSPLFSGAPVVWAVLQCKQAWYLTAQFTSFAIIIWAPYWVTEF